MKSRWLSVLYDSLGGMEVVCVASVAYLKAKQNLKWQAVYILIKKTN
ncbi:MAG: hypothetical protein IGS23_23910 [Rivularia sp. T60_A2020_040]|nr:hypothetical protein [Rivularia sp. T60_A2020_040]